MSETTDPKIDAYIESRADFAKPMLTHFRSVVHATCPEATEAMKWSFPHFVYKDKNLASMAAFKAHASFGFWYSEDETPERQKQGGMGHLGRIASMDDMPSDAELKAMIVKAAALIDAGGKPAWMERKKAREPIPVAPELAAAIAADPAAAKVWAGFSPSHVRDYAEWIADAKRPETRNKRIVEAVGWIAEGKGRHWKYQR